MIESKGLNIVVSKQITPKCNEFPIRAQYTQWIPPSFKGLSFEDIIKMINEILTDKAYIRYIESPVYTGYSMFMYFVSETDAMAFKLKWE